MADARSLIALGMAPPLAKEVVAQIEAGIGNARRLMALAMVATTAKELAAQITAGVGNARRLSGLDVPPELAGQLVTLIAGLGVGAPGYGFLVDELGGYFTDELGDRIIGQPEPASAYIKNYAAARGIKFGVATKPEFLDANPAYWALIQQEASMLVPETAFQPKNIQNVHGVFTFDKAQAFVAYANAANLPYRFPAGMIYPRHDMAWVSTYDEATQTIIPTLDGNGQPNLNASNWQYEIDNHFETIRAQPWSGAVTSINVSNETIDPLQGDGWRRHPWYTATNGPGWLVYAFQKARELWPSTRLGLCQDITEQAPNSYYTNLRADFLANLEQLMTLGAPIDYVDLQGHLTFERGYDPISHRAFLDDVKSLGLKVIVGELDIRTGNTGAFIPGNYTNAQYDRLAAYIVSQYLDTIMPYLDGKEFVVWGLSDAYQAWNAGERPLLFDASLVKKPAMYAAVYEHLGWR